MKESNRQFAENLKRLRAGKGETQQTLSDKLNITRPMIGAYEEGRCKPSLDNLTRIADYFGITVDALIRK